MMMMMIAGAVNLLEAVGAEDADPSTVVTVAGSCDGGAEDWTYPEQSIQIQNQAHRAIRVFPNASLTAPTTESFKG